MTDNIIAMADALRISHKDQERVITIDASTYRGLECKDWTEEDLARINAGESWKETWAIRSIGPVDWHVPCRVCGKRVPPFVCGGSREERLLCVVPAVDVHQRCLAPKTEEQRQAESQERLTETLMDPDAETQARVRRAGQLPDRTIPGLHKLEVFAPQQEAIDQARLLLSRFQTPHCHKRERGLYLHGPTGSGKSAIAKALAYDLIQRTGTIHDERGRLIARWGPATSVQFWSAPDLFDRIYAHYGGKKEGVDVLTVKSANVLVLDDLDKGFNTAHKLQVIFDLVNSLYEARKCLLVTSNQSPAELALSLARKLGEDHVLTIQAIMGRIAEVCSIVPVTGNARLSKVRQNQEAE